VTAKTRPKIVDARSFDHHADAKAYVGDRSGYTIDYYDGRYPVAKIIDITILDPADLLASWYALDK
jgi:hypothetical protein